jgi:hypothetical protein
VGNGLYAVGYLHDQFIADLLVWHYLAWLGKTVRRSDSRVQRLIAKGTEYALQQRRELFTIIGELMASTGIVGSPKVVGSGYSSRLTHTRSYRCS